MLAVFHHLLTAGLPLNLIHEIEIALVEVVHPDIAILATTRICSALWMDCNGVQRAKMSPHSSNLILKDLMIEPRLEFTLSCTGSGDVHSGLSTTEDDEVFPGCYGSGIERSVSGVGLENFEIAGADNFSSLVFAGGYEICLVGRKLDVVDGGVVFVDFDIAVELTGLKGESVFVGLQIWLCLPLNRTEIRCRLRGTR